MSLSSRHLEVRMLLTGYRCHHDRPIEFGSWDRAGQPCNGKPGFVSTRQNPLFLNPPNFDTLGESAVGATRRLGIPINNTTEDANGPTGDRYPPIRIGQPAESDRRNVSFLGAFQTKTESSLAAG